ncbi:DUF1501 domain-containing protein [Flavilitoribacter nigricans]|uniref:DUF1501 domain-containing protein n=1 Tax=Flavilitoribacter nigricans (strain ATCC 23147 / DSM 23189 / NBRC 102662 / NCIMB 1420 / SS-2) TaxID=1122177 RepID=A0A2D0NA84_FLAN2|nr:DUF1501 domain-containing protein [Flavilitoribacter nigricans]PHN05432.1 hypothetical protein CRP01_15660 [Flavilitoribacter nigricans DSM 23189 = NBRC 102662]
MKRRHFLKYSAAGVVLPNLINGFGIKALGANPWMSALTNTTTDTDKVLVLIRLDGGNDGLNTVVPLDQYGKLTQVRPQVVLPENSTLQLEGQDRVGLHPAMSGMQSLYNEGKLKIIQSVGYPNPNYSHFRATDIWMSGSDADQLVNSGWAGRYLHEEFPNFPAEFPNQDMPDPLSLEIGATVSLALQGPFAAMGMSVVNPAEFYELINGVQTPAPATPAGELLSHVRTVKRQSNAYGQVIVQAFGKAGNIAEYPGENFLAEQLKIVARLIAGGLKTRIYMVSIGSFDTHDNQVVTDNTTQGEHAELLKRVSEGINAFQKDIEALGVADRVTGMTFSEFGRRIISNFSNGTDHGAAAPLFLFGKAIEGGVLGDNPDIPVDATVESNLPMQYDFRSVYATVLKNWFCVPPDTLRDILYRDYQDLPVFSTVNCLPTSVRDRNLQAGRQLLNIYPNPFTSWTRLRFESDGGPVILQVFNNAGQLVANPANGIFPRGEHQVDWHAEELPAGQYYIRIQLGGLQQVRGCLKVRN